MTGATVGMCVTAETRHLDRPLCVGAETRRLDRLGQLGEFEPDSSKNPEQESNTGTAVCCETVRDLQLLVSDPIPSL